MNNNEKYSSSYGGQQGQGTTTNSAEQQQNIRHNHQYYGFTAKATTERESHGLHSLLPPLSLSLSPLPLSPSLSL